MALVSFYFRITNIAPRPGSRPRGMPRGVWLPPEGGNSIATSSQLFYFDGRTVYDVTYSVNPPAGSQEFGVCSMYHDFSTFWAVDYDATQHLVNQADNRDWTAVGFDHSTPTINWVGIGGGQRRLGVQRNQSWVHALFPENHQPRRYSTDERYGGLCGELPVIIALIAFSMDPEYLAHVLTHCMREGTWEGHSYPHGRDDGRGMIVTVFTVPGASTAEALEEFETRRIFPA